MAANEGLLLYALVPSTSAATSIERSGCDLSYSFACTAKIGLSMTTGSWDLRKPRKQDLGPRPKESIEHATSRAGSLRNAVLLLELEARLRKSCVGAVHYKLHEC